MGCALEDEKEGCLLVEPLVSYKSIADKTLVLNGRDIPMAHIPVLDDSTFYLSQGTIFFYSTAKAKNYPQNKEVFRVELRAGVYTLVPRELELSNRRLLLLDIGSSKSGVDLQLGHRVKVGKWWVTVAGLARESGTEKVLQDQAKLRKELEISDDEIIVQESEESLVDDCRVCKKATKKRNNPLLEVCKCQPASIHLECLKAQQEPNFRVQRSSKCVAVRRVSENKCPKCNTALRQSYSVGGHDYSLAPNIPGLEAPYIKLEVQQTGLTPDLTDFYLLCASKRTLQVGGPGSEVELFPGLKKNLAEITLRRDGVHYKDNGLEQGSLLKFSELQLAEEKEYRFVVDSYRLRMGLQSGVKAGQSKEVLRKVPGLKAYCLKFIKRISEDVFQEKSDSDLSINQLLDS